MLYLKCLIHLAHITFCEFEIEKSPDLLLNNTNREYYRSLFVKILLQGSYQVKLNAIKLNKNLAQNVI